MREPANCLNSKRQKVYQINELRKILFCRLCKFAETACPITGIEQPGIVLSIVVIFCQFKEIARILSHPPARRPEHSRFFLIPIDFKVPCFGTDRNMNFYVKFTSLALPGINVRLIAKMIGNKQYELNTCIAHRDRCRLEWEENLWQRTRPPGSRGLSLAIQRSPRSAKKAKGSPTAAIQFTTSPSMQRLRKSLIFSSTVAYLRRPN